jgi:hypothetical protein
MHTIILNASSIRTANWLGQFTVFWLTTSGRAGNGRQKLPARLPGVGPCVQSVTATSAHNGEYITVVNTQTYRPESAFHFDLHRQ